MMKIAQLIQTINWQQPWLVSLCEVAAPLLQSTDRLRALNERAMLDNLRTHGGAPLRFVPQSDLPPDTAYEAFIGATGCIPTRENLHDFFNALVWLTFPRIKAELNALQAAQIGKFGVGKSRGPARDAATIFDENAALLVTRDADLVLALRAHRWQEAFLGRRTSFGRDSEVWLFGHALMEKLVAPYKAITAHAWVVVADAAFFAMSGPDKRDWIDATVAEKLAHGLTTFDFIPLPVLGVPGWWDSQDEAFYDDAAVFRPRRTGKSVA
jgi:hypothetical protein